VTFSHAYCTITFQLVCNRLRTHNTVLFIYRSRSTEVNLWILYTMNFLKRQAKCSLSVLHFLAQKSPEIVCRRGSARTRWVSLQRSSDSLAGLTGLLLTPQLKRGTTAGNDLDLYVGRYVTATSSRRHLLVGPIAGRRRSDASHLRRHDVGPICRADAALHRPDIQPPLVIFIRIKVQHKVTAIIE